METRVRREWPAFVGKVTPRGRGLWTQGNEVGATKVQEEAPTGGGPAQVVLPGLGCHLPDLRKGEILHKQTSNAEGTQITILRNLLIASTCRRTSP